MPKPRQPDLPDMPSPDDHIRGVHRDMELAETPLGVATSRAENLRWLDELLSDPDLPAHDREYYEALRRRELAR